MLASQIAESEIGNQDSGTRKELWLKMAEQLVDDGIPKDKVSSNIIKLVTSQMRTQTKNPELRKNIRFNNSWFSLTMSEHGYTDSERGHNKANPDRDQKILPYDGQNSEFVNLLEDIRDTTQMIRERCKTISDKKGIPVDFKKELDIKNYAELIRDLKTAAKIADNDTNLKTKVPENATWIFKKSMEVTATLVKIGNAFLQTRIKLNDKYNYFLTTKQAVKFSRGKEPNILPVFTPKNRDEAIFANWYGVKCKCDSWRVQAAKTGGANKVECVDCGNKFEAKTLISCPKCYILLYDRRLTQAKTGTCPGCKKPIDLPESVK